MNVVTHIYYTAENPIWQKIGGLASALVKDWADLHGYDFREHKIRVWPKVGATWGKIKILLDSIRQNDASHHVFIDADIFITNPEISLNDILSGEPDALLYVGSDWVFPLNTGFMIATPESKKILDRLSKLRAACPYGYFEQGTLQVLRELCEKCERDIHPIHWDKVNTYPPNISENWAGTWTTQSFLCHFAGWKKNEIIEFLRPAFSLNPLDARELIFRRLQDTRSRIKLQKSFHEDQFNREGVES